MKRRVCFYEPASGKFYATAEFGASADWQAVLDAFSGVSTLLQFMQAAASVQEYDCTSLPGTRIYSCKDLSELPPADEAYMCGGGRI